MYRPEVMRRHGQNIYRSEVIVDMVSIYLRSLGNAGYHSV